MATSIFMGCTQQTNLRYALCISHLSNNFTNTLARAIRDRADELGIDLVVLDAQQSVARQANQIETLVNDGIAGIIIEPAATKGLDDALDLCEQQGIPVVLVTQRIANEATIDCFVGPDSREGGRLQMAYCLEQLNNQGEIVILHGPVGASAQQLRYLGYHDVLLGKPDVQIVAELNADWSESKAQEIVANWLAAGKRFDAVVAQNDEMALGALAALEAIDLADQVVIVGVDASPEAISAVYAGKMSATISQQTDLQGTQALDACIALANHQTIQKEIFIDQLIVSEDSIH
ncbi:MAG: sugar ABC transporter substrate-binding protein [Eubacteriales bacterium]|nr:sugar ABC transporter substrate-binding protein [Eubacteriales bacterium]